MIRKQTHTVDQVLERYRGVMDDGEANHYRKTRAEFDGDELKFSSHRLWTFAEHGIECVQCGLEADFFAKEKHTEDEGSYHLNLYALDEDGAEVLMTKDHIVPKSEGGDDHISNYQTMCEPCNEAKGATTDA